jgi:cholesterol transport system auxiliary component
MLRRARIARLPELRTVFVPSQGGFARDDPPGVPRHAAVGGVPADPRRLRAFDQGAVHPPLCARHTGIGRSQRSVAANPNGKILEVAQISVPEWLSGTAMYYRLDYRDDNQLAAYAQSDWIAPPAAMLEPILRRSLAGGGWRAVIGPRNPATADASLQLRLDDFSQAFAQPGESEGVLDATATLIDSHNDRVIAQKHFHVEVAAATADAQGGAEALAEASRKFAAQVQGWAQAAATRQDGRGGFPRRMSR